MKAFRNVCRAHEVSLYRTVKVLLHPAPDVCIPTPALYFSFIFHQHPNFEWQGFLQPLFKWAALNYSDFLGNSKETPKFLANQPIPLPLEGRNMLEVTGEKSLSANTCLQQLANNRKEIVTYGQMAKGLMPQQYASSLWLSMQVHF